jgi:hypothetical protein
VEINANLFYTMRSTHCDTHHWLEVGRVFFFWRDIFLLGRVRGIRSLRFFVGHDEIMYKMAV